MIQWEARSKVPFLVSQPITPFMWGWGPTGLASWTDMRPDRIWSKGREVHGRDEVTQSHPVSRVQARWQEGPGLGATAWVHLLCDNFASSTLLISALFNIYSIITQIHFKKSERRNTWTQRWTSLMSWNLKTKKGVCYPFGLDMLVCPLLLLGNASYGPFSLDSSDTRSLLHLFFCFLPF